MALDNTSFSTLELPEALTVSLASLGYESMTSIQSQALPSVLGGQDVIAKKVSDPISTPTSESHGGAVRGRL